MWQWIRLDDLKPRQDQDVLAWCGWCITAVYGDGAFVTEDKTNQIFGVTHWMPLPEPPEVKL